MNTSSILAEIDKKLADLQAARVAIAALASTDTIAPIRRGRGRPPKHDSAPKPSQRKITDEGRARIAAAQKRRWATKKKAAKKMVNV